MSCLPLSGGCERPLIEPFVVFLNADEGAEFNHVSCLDVWERNLPQPEALYLDNRTKTRLVVERKTAVWPPGHAREHRNCHSLMDHVSAGLVGAYKGNALAIRIKRLEANSKENIRALSRGIVKEVIARAGASACDSCFKIDVADSCVEGRFEFNREDVRGHSGLLFVFDLPARPVPSSEDLPVEMESMLIGFYLSCRKKFEQYWDARRVLLIDPCGAVDLVSVNWWKKVFQKQAPDACIDEIWLVFQDDDAVGETHWSIDLLFSQELGAGAERSGAIGLDEVFPAGHSTFSCTRQQTS